MVPNTPSAAEATGPRAPRKAIAGGAKLSPRLPTGRPPGAAIWTFMLWIGLVSMFGLLLVTIARY